MDEKIYQEFFEHSVDLFCIINAEGYFVELNNAWTDTLGYSLLELKSKPYTEFIHPQDRNPSIEAVDISHYTHITPEYFENRYITKNGSIRVIKWTGNVKKGRILGIGRDVTKNKIVAQQIARDHQIIKAIEEIQNDVASSHDSKLIYETILKVLIRLTHCNLGMLGHIEYIKDVPIMRNDSILQLSRDHEPHYTRETPLLSLSPTEFKSVCSYTMETHQVNICNASLLELEMSKTSGYKNFITIPFCLSTDLIAIVGLFNREQAFNTGLLIELQTVFNVCSRVIAGLQEVRRHQRQMEHLTSQYMAMCQTLNILSVSVMYLNDTLFVEHINSSFAHQLGYSQDTIVHKHVSHFLKGLDLDFLSRVFPEKKEPQQTVEHTASIDIKTQSGQPVTLQIRICQIQAENKTFYILINE